VRFRRSGKHVKEAARAHAASRATAGRMADTRVVPEHAGPGQGRRGTGRGGASDTFRR
jgi:hypothetical protein